jgi:FkbM family methyltransferase
MRRQPEITGTRKVQFPVAGRYTQDIARSADGLLWLHGKGSHDVLAIHHEMDPPGKSIHDYICAHFRPGLVFLDVGAHVGHYTIRAAKAGCIVYAVEANPETAAQLRMNQRVNKLEGITLWAFAAWDQPAVLTFNGDTEDEAFRSGGNSLMPGGNRADLSTAVAGMPLNRLLSGVPVLDLVKIDVEGADLKVLEGMRTSLVRLRPKLIIEDHSPYGYFAPVEFDLMQDDLAQLAGYRWTTAAAEGVEGLTNYRIGIPS